MENNFIWGLPLLMYQPRMGVVSNIIAVALLEASYDRHHHQQQHYYYWRTRTYMMMMIMVMILDDTEKKKKNHHG